MRPNCFTAGQVVRVRHEDNLAAELRQLAALTDRIGRGRYAEPDNIVLTKIAVASRLRGLAAHLEAGGAR